MTTPVVSPELAQNEFIQPKLPPLPKTLESPGNKMVFAGGKTDATRSLESVSDPIRAELPTLRELQKLNPTREREQQIFNLERKRKRSMSFALIQTRGTEEQKKIIEKRGSFEELRASDALFLKKKGVDLANLFLVTDTNPTSSVSRDAIKEKDNFIVNFGENKNINAIIGAGDILPPTVSHVRINGVEGERKHFPRPGYYDAKGKYLPIFDGDKLEIVKMGEVDEKILGEYNKADEEWMNHIAEEEIREEAVRKLSLEEKKSFMDNATKVAKTIEEQYGIPWQVTVGQAALESGYGKSKLAANEGNYFGIKGEGKVFATREVYNGREVMEAASFRTYSDMKESFIDYAKFLTKNPRYRDAFQYAKNIDPRPSYYPKDYSAENFSPKKFIEAIKDAGYATDPIYVDKIASVWKTNDIEVA